MADTDASEKGDKNQSKDGDEKTCESCEETERSESKNPSTLEQFIMDNYAQQKSEGRHDATADIDDDRTANFYARAIGESRRMCQEVEKSREKLEKLHSELGADKLAAWRTEHAAEVLLPEEAEKIAMAEQIYA
ncbi:uncharacterized protein LOC135464948 [Liolophura sinensis]|uniref:uncharacterized protein LOC135464948 n=1 Tax=Liolophura sinensis TaxID=3198878 RepID=UPI003158A34E